MPKISVIVPVFNAEKYLQRCIDSILIQTFSDFELLLIDDGSTDSSGKICDDYAKLDSRIKVFHKPNGGVSSARNLGLDQAKGEYITFVDSDDRLTDKSFNIFNSKINADFIVTSYTEYNGVLKQIQISDTNSFLYGDKMIEFLKKNINTTTIKTPWGKFFKNKLINIRFDDKIICGEDFLFVLTYLKKVDSIFIVCDSSYIYSVQEIHFYKKYQQSIECSAYTLYNIFNAYKQLNIIIPSFECNIFYDYKSLCENEICKSPSLWYNDERVLFVYKEIKKYLGILPRLYNFLMRNRLISIILIHIRGRC